MRALALACLLTVGCGDSSTTKNGPSAAVLTELDALARVPNRAVALESALVTQGTINVGGTDDEILAAVSSRLGAETNDCAQRSAAAGTLSVIFTDPGCTTATAGVVFSGTATITISHSDTLVQIVTHFDGKAAGEAWTGEVVVATSDGNQFLVRTLASLDGFESDVPKFSALAESGKSHITAAGTQPSPVPGQAPRNLGYTGLTQFFFACHPSEGSITLTSPGENLSRTLTYQTESTTTGLAMYGDGTTTRAVTLPTNASCASPR